MHVVFWLENLKGSDHLEYLDVDGKVIIEWILGNIWLRTGAIGGPL
jgi:hypothetical protein